MSFRKWILNIRELARSDVHIANLLLDTQPIGVSLSADETSAAPVIVNPVSHDKLTQDEIDLILQRKLISSIKMIRERTGLGLKEAKDLAEGWKNRNRNNLHPDLFQTP